MKKWFLSILMMSGLVAGYAGPMGTCGNLSAMEQTFVSGMSAANQEMFCSRFTQSMRDSAMKMSGMPDSQGNMMSPDQAVEKVARDNNVAPAPAGSKGGCAVK
jgi:hypothetical protein